MRGVWGCTADTQGTLRTKSKQRAVRSPSRHKSMSTTSAAGLTVRDSVNPYLAARATLLLVKHQAVQMILTAMEKSEGWSQR